MSASSIFIIVLILALGVLVLVTFFPLVLSGRISEDERRNGKGD